jgi:hypothetical protein
MSQLKKSASAFVPAGPKKKGCGCQATRHACVGSCIGCGRVYCEEESEFVGAKCLFCKGESVFASLSASGLSQQSLNGSSDGDQMQSMIRAYTNKDRLLQYDQENAQRTHVHDAQADYYESSTWLSAEEKATIDAKRKRARDAKLPSNRRYQMNMALDASGRKVTANTRVVVDEDEDEEEEGEGGGMEPPNSSHYITPSLHQSTSSTSSSALSSAAPPLNAGLEGSKEKAGDVYRLLTESLAPWRSAGGSSSPRQKAI